MCHGVFVCQSVHLLTCVSWCALVGLCVMVCNILVGLCVMVCTCWLVCHGVYLLACVSWCVLVGLCVMVCTCWLVCRTCWIVCHGVYLLECVSWCVHVIACTCHGVYMSWRVHVMACTCHGVYKTMLITPPLLQRKCGVLMQDRCMKGADHATYPSAVLWCSDAGYIGA